MRFGGTITIEDAFDRLGFDHIAIAAGAGTPTIVRMKNNLIRGIRKASDFLRAAERTLALDRRVNGEFYLDVVLDQAAADGLDVRVLEVDRYVCWGTPRDLEANS